MYFEKSEPAKNAGIYRARKKHLSRAQNQIGKRRSIGYKYNEKLTSFADLDICANNLKSVLVICGRTGRFKFLYLIRDRQNVWRRSLRGSSDGQCPCSRKKFAGARSTIAVNIHKAVRSTSSMFRTTSTVHFPPFPLAGNLSASLCCPYFGSVTEVSKPNENSVVELEHILRVNKCGTMVCELFLQKKLFTPFLF